MASVTTDPARSRTGAIRHLPTLAITLAGIALLLLALGPLGWRLGWWHFRFAFTWLLPYAGYAGLGAAVVGLAALALGGGALGWRRALVAVLAFAAGAAIAYVPWHYDRLRRIVPPIHDISTDTGTPPDFVAILPLRNAEGGNTAAYDPKTAEQQRKSYPDIGPAVLGLPPPQAFERALATAKRLGWTIVAADPDAYRIEAYDRSRWFGFTDDIVIRVTPSGTGSRVDLRSVSRWGRSDFGVNAARIRRFLAALA